ncbi:bile acid:sodium symporter family protein [Corynebacterium sp. CCM 9203]|uniref:bile acid:sodium symporter family protein n=1 Tax=Corynebacterium sp. CCM 9203 TaxID=3057615 RepID=UPI0035237B23
MSLLDSHSAPHSPQASHTEERSATLAVLAFPAVVILCALIAYLTPGAFIPMKPWITPGLMVIMFCMGLTLTLPDIGMVVKRPWPIFLGVVAQYIVMPLSAVLVAKLLNLGPEIAIGLLMLGSVPGGTASNVIAYLAKGDVALSVAMTSVSTLLSPIVTPMLMLYLADAQANVDAAGMTWSLVKTVLIPVGLGLALRMFFGRLVNAILPVLPWLSIGTIGLVIMVVVALSAAKLAVVGFVVLLGVMIQNLIGYIIGYYAPKLMGQKTAACRTTAIEVSTQNSGLASALSTQFFTPEAALPGAIAAIWANVSGAIYAAIVRRRPLRD